MRKTNKAAADKAHSLARTISRIEADLQSLKDEYRVMAEEMAAAQLAAAEAGKAQDAAEAARDAAVARLAEVEKEVQTERTVRALAAAKLRETFDLLDPDGGPADAPQRHDADGSDAIREGATLSVPEAAIAPGRLPRAVSAACVDLVARGVAIDIAAALLHLAELGLRTLDHPVLSETPHSDARPKLLPSPG